MGEFKTHQHYDQRQFCHDQQQLGLRRESTQKSLHGYYKIVVAMYFHVEPHWYAGLRKRVAILASEALACSSISVNARVISVNAASGGIVRDYAINRE